MAEPFLSLVIPAYNEAATIERAIQETCTILAELRQPYEFLIIDDGSTDATAQLVQQQLTPEIRLIRHPRNQGKGAAIHTSMHYAKGEWLVFLDADLSVHPRTLRELMTQVTDTDVIIGSRRLAETRIERAQPWHRILAGRAMNGLIRTWLHLPYRDTQCGWKAFRRPLIDRIKPHVQTRGWLFDVELLLLAQQHNARIKEYPVTWINGQESKLSYRHIPQIWRELRTLKKRFPRA